MNKSSKITQVRLRAGNAGQNLNKQTNKPCSQFKIKYSSFHFSDFYTGIWQSPNQPETSVKMSKLEILEKFSSSFEKIKESQFCVYKNASNLYENLVNTLAVARKLTRKAGLHSELCEIEVTYKDLKAKDFPEDLIRVEVLKACSNIPSKSRPVQKKISNFFPPKVQSFQVGFGKAPAENTEMIEDNVQHEPTLNIENVEIERDKNVGEDFIETAQPGPEISVDGNKNCVAAGVKQLFEVLDLKNGHEMSKNINWNENLELMSLQTTPLLKTYFEKNRIVNENAKYFILNSKSSELKGLVENKVFHLKENLHELVEYTLIPKDLMDQKTLSEATKYLEFCDKKRREIEPKIILAAMELKNLLKDLNRRFDKRISNLNLKQKEDSVNITCVNGDKTWDQCMDAVESVTEGVFKVSLEDFEKTKNFFNWLAREKHEYCIPKDVVDYLGWPISSARFLTKIMVQSFPIIHLKRGPLSVLVDAEQFFGSAIQICQLMNTLDKP